MFLLTPVVSYSIHVYLNSSLGGIHQPEPKCHLDMKSNFIILWGGGYINQNQNVTLTCNSNFIIWGGVHLQVDPKNVRFTDSGWLSTTVLNEQTAVLKIKCSFLDYI